MKMCRAPVPSNFYQNIHMKIVGQILLPFTDRTKRDVTFNKRSEFHYVSVSLSVCISEDYGHAPLLIVLKFTINVLNQRQRNFVFSSLFKITAVCEPFCSYDLTLLKDSREISN